MVLQDVEVVAEQLDDELGPGAGDELVDAAGDRLAEGEGHAGNGRQGVPHLFGQFLAGLGRGPFPARLEHADVAGLLHPPGFEGDARLAGFADDRHELGELHQLLFDLAAHLHGFGQRDARQELEVHVESALVHDRHELRPQPGDEGQRPGREGGRTRPTRTALWPRLQRRSGR